MGTRAPFLVPREMHLQGQWAGREKPTADGAAAEAYKRPTGGSGAGRFSGGIPAGDAAGTEYRCTSQSLLQAARGLCIGELSAAGVPAPRE